MTSYMLFGLAGEENAIRIFAIAGILLYMTR